MYALYVPTARQLELGVHVYKTTGEKQRFRAWIDDDRVSRPYIERVESVRGRLDRTHHTAPVSTGRICISG